MDNAEACVIRIRTLGDLGIWVGPKSVHIPSRRALGILVYLADQAGRTFTRDHLADLFWADKAQERARHSFSQVLYSMRRTLPQLCFDRVDEIVCLRNDNLTIDTEIIRAAKRSNSPSIVVQNYRGRFLDGFHIPAAHNFEDWREGINHQLESIVRWAVRQLSTEAETDGDWLKVEELARHELSLNPDDPDVARRLAEAISKGGDPVRALNEIRRTRIAVGITEGSPRINERCGEPEAAFPDDAAETPQPLLRFVGREVEFGQLREIWQKIESGSGKYVLLSGEAGIGKTRLAVHLLRLVALRGGTVISGRCYGSEKQIPFSGIANALVGQIRRFDLDALPPGPRSQLALLFGAKAGRRRRGAQVASPFDVPTVVDVLGQLLRNVALPGVLFLDDMHWADERTIECVFRLARQMRNEMLLMLGAIRSEEIVSNEPLRLALSALEDTTTILPLSELNESQVVALIKEAEASQGVRLPVWLRRQVVAQAAGRPLFVLEAIKTAIARKPETDATHAVGSWSKPLCTLAPTVEQLLCRRLELLGNISQALISALSVLGREAPLALIQRVARLRLIHAVDGLRELIANGIVIDTGVSIRFVHDVTREAVYRATPPSYLRLLHSRAAKALAGQSDTHSGTLAIHYDAAGNSDRAYENALEAAAVARDLSAAADQEFYLRLALKNAEDDSRRRLTEAAIADLLAVGRRYAEAEQVYQRLRPWFEATEDSDRLLAAEVCRLAFELTNGSSEARQLLERSQELARRVETLADLSLQVRLVRTLVSSAHDVGEVVYLEGLLKTLTALDYRGRDRRAAAEILAIVANAQCIYADASVATETAERAAALAEETRDASVIVIARIAQGQANLVAGRLAMAKRRFEEAFTIVEDSGCRQHRDRVLINYAVTLMEMGRIPEAMQAFGESIQLAPPHDQVVAAANLAALYCDSGNSVLGREWALKVQHLNRHLNVRWASLFSDACVAYCAFLDRDYTVALRLAEPLVHVTDTHLRPLSDCSHSTVFLARILEATDSWASACSFIKSVASATNSVPLTGQLRMQLEIARLMAVRSSEMAEDAIIATRDAAERAGAEEIARQAKDLLVRIAGARAATVTA
jgi:predicted ATPase/DNA-binding SARP family transcriptional activator